MQKYLQALSRFTKLSEPSIRLISERTVHKIVPKGTMLKREGQIARQFFWIEKGILRGRIAPKGEVITTWFATQYMFCSSMPSFIMQKPSIESVEALADSELYALSRHDVLELFKITPEMSSIVRKMAEEAFVHTLQRNYEFQSLSAKERYESFVEKYPKLLQKIPLGMIATYIGITQQSLSRIRKQR
ncbi:MAG: Crp/Fnr family transcriptional regulator [Bacteroidota bacterium]